MALNSKKQPNPLSTERYFGRGYYHLYRHYLLPAEQTRAEAEFLLARLRPRLAERWLDLPCGYGRHLAALAALRPDLRLCGGDLNRAYLSEPGLTRCAALAVCDMRRLPFATASFDAALNLLNSFGYYPPGSADALVRNPQAAIRNQSGRGRPRSQALCNPQFLDDRGVLAELARVLRPGGRLVLDLANRRALLALVRRQPVFRYAAGGCEALERFAWDERAQVLRNETVWRWAGGPERARYRLRLYTPAQIRAMLERTGFAAPELLGGFDGSPFDPRESERMLLVTHRLK